MKRTLFRAFLVFATCSVVVCFAWIGFSRTDVVVIATTEQTSFDSEPSVPEQNVEAGDDHRASLDKYWIADDQTKHQGFVIQRKCKSIEDFENCVLTISRNGKRLRSFEITDGRKDWLKYGFFDFLGNGSKQLVVHTFSGGAHCCYDYEIFDLDSQFRTIYTSTKYDSGSQIGNELIPVDIDGNGVFEFYQDVMAFGYLGPNGHATAVFPPAIFAFNMKGYRYELATNQFPEFVLKRLKEKIDRLEPWKKENEKYGTRITQDEIDEITVRETFLYWVYAGKREDAWKYFERNYRSETGDKYPDKFRDKFTRDFQELFDSDPTYRSIYGDFVR